MLSAVNPEIGNSLGNLDFWHSGFPRIQGQDPGKKKPINYIKFGQKVNRGERVSQNVTKSDRCESE